MITWYGMGGLVLRLYLMAGKRPGRWTESPLRDTPLEKPEEGCRGFPAGWKIFLRCFIPKET